MPLAFSWPIVQIGRCCGFVLLALLVAGATFGQAEDDGFMLGLGVGCEWDDNVTLASGLPGDEILDDYVLRAQPSIKWQTTHRDNRFSLAADAHVRRGLDTDLNEGNFRAEADAKLRHPSGLRGRIRDTFSRTTFDQALFASATDLIQGEAGVNKTIANVTELQGRYSPSDRLSAELGYTLGVAKLDSGAKGGVDDTRTTQLATAKLVVPVAREWLVYAAGAFAEQDDDLREEFIYDRVRAVGGLRWEASERLTAWVEGGVERVDYTDGPGQEFDNPIVLGGLNIRWSEKVIVEAKAGTDGYDNPIGGFLFNYLGDESTFKAIARRSTENSFSRSTAGRTFDATLASVGYDRKLGASFVLKLDATYFQLQSGASDEQNDRTSSLRGELLYKFRPWLDLSTAYRLSERRSKRAENRFEDNRAGIYLTIKNR